MRISDWSSDVCSSDLPDHLVRGKRHLVEVVAIELDGYVAANTRDQFIEAKLNRLANLVELAELTASGLLDALNDIGLGIDPRWPPVLRLQDPTAVRDVRCGRKDAGYGLCRAVLL